MNNKIRKIVIILFLLLSALVVALAVVAGIFEDQVGKQIVKSISNSLNSKLTIDHVDLSLIRAFPNAAVNLSGFVLEDTQQDTLMKADNLSFRFKILSLFGSNIHVSSILAENGALAIRYDKKGKANYEVFKETEDNSDASSDFLVSLQEAILKNIALTYTDALAKQEAYILVKNAVFSGQFSSSKFALDSKVSLHSDSILVESERFLSNKDLTYQSEVLIDMAEGIYRLQKVNLDVEGNKFDLDGVIKASGEEVDFDLVASNERGSMEAVLQWLPQSYLDYLGDFSSKGEFYFNALVQGKWSQKLMPAIDVKFGLKEGRLSHPNLSDDFKDVSFDAQFNNGEARSNQSSIFELSQLKGYIDNELIEAKLKAEDLDNPLIDFTLSGVVPVKSIYGFLDNELISNGSGALVVKDFHLKGRYSDMQSINNVSRVEANGNLIFDDITLKINEENVLLDRGYVLLEGNKLTIDSVRFEGVGNELFLDGTFYNVLPVFFADSLNTQNAELLFQANLNAPQMDIDRLIALSMPPIEENKTTALEIDSIKSVEVQQRQHFTQFLRGTFHAKVGQFNYGKIEGANFDGTLQFNGVALNIMGSTKAMEGQFDLAGTMYFLDRPYLKARLVATNVNAQQFFYQSDNFGQTILTDKHLRGKMSSKLSIHAYWDEKMNFLYDQLRVLAQLDIKNGALIKFEMFEYFGTYIKIDDLNHVKFADLQNWLEVRNQKVYIPAMFIQSNAVNLTLSGQYAFNYDFDFNFKINAGQVMANRLKKHNPQMNPLPAKQKGMFNMYAKVFGNLDKYNYKMASKQVKEDFERSEERKNQIRTSLEDEFGNIINLEEPTLWDDIPNASEGEDFLFDEAIEGEQENFNQF
ncbi:MAG: hypothetical protein HC892_01255 [Saprospiraceae bacterium]|nr:hypothetical protein [Saprospiraceae bacterium]